MFLVKMSAILVVSAYVAPQLPDDPTGGYGPFGLLAGVMIGLEAARRLLDARQAKKQPPSTPNGMAATLKQMAETLKSIESASNANVTILHVIKQMHEQTQKDIDEVRRKIA
jgi:hypothetical protein